MRRVIPCLLLLFLIFGISLLFRLGSLPLCGADEPRYARIAEEMGNQGRWVTPVLEGKPWLEKPPLYYWITIPEYSLFESKEVAARFGPAICALTAALAVFWAGTSLWSLRAGFMGAAILLTSLGFIGYGRSASTDMPFTCCFTVFGVLQLAAASRRPPARIFQTLLAYVFLGLAVLAKGPVAIILAGGIMLLVWFLDDRGGLFRKWLAIPGALVAAAVSIPWFWFAFKQNGFGFIATFFINHNLARYTTAIHHHSQPFVYYIPVLLGLLFPWSSWLPLLISKSPLKEISRWREWDLRMVFLAGWFLFPIAFFSLSNSKLAGYILPSIPPMALILGVYVSRPLERARLRIAGIVELIFAVGMAIAVPLFFQKEYGGALKTGLLISAAISIPAVFSIVFKLNGKPLHAFGATAMQGVMLILALTQFAFPTLGDYQSTREIARRALQLRHSGEPIVTYRFFHHTLHYYTGYRVAAKLDDPHSLVGFVRKNPGSLVVTNEGEMKVLAGLKDLSVTQVGTQGEVRLLRAYAGRP